MEIIAACYTDAGSIKQINQDSLSLKVADSPKGKILFAVVCDGMGGLEHGEVASREVVVAFNNWFSNRFAKMVAEDSFSKEILDEQWITLITMMNERIAEYAAQRGVMMGTTATALLVFGGEYFVCHVGDSRVYRIDEDVELITTDHTLVEQEVAFGRMTRKEAMEDPRRNILLQCVGASDFVVPQLETGEVLMDTTFILSSDGFVHVVAEEELKEWFAPRQIEGKRQLEETCRKVVKCIMKRGERDNITVVAAALKHLEQRIYGQEGHA